MPVIEAVIVGYLPSWGKWPDSSDTDYNAILGQRVDAPYSLHGAPLTLRTRRYPVHRAYAVAGQLKLPPHTPHPFINNLNPPPQPVLDAMIYDLDCVARDGCQLCLWEHAYQCYPYVAQHLRRIFKHSILLHGDDAPGSTEIKTAPIAKFFDSVLHGNLVWHPGGEHTAALYRRLGVADTHYVTMSMTGGFVEGLGAWGQHVEPAPAPGTVVMRRSPLHPMVRRAEVDLERRLAGLRAGQYQYDLVFVGANMGQQRPKLNRPETTQALATAGLRTKFHGVGMRDGELAPRNPAALGTPVAQLYLNAFAVLNLQFVGLMGTRVYDAWAAGNLLVQWDPVGELDLLGVRAGEHYAGYDGTIPGLIRTVRYYQAHFDETERIIRAGHEQGPQLSTQHSVYGGVQAVLQKFAHKWEVR